MKYRFKDFLTLFKLNSITIPCPECFALSNGYYSKFGIVWDGLYKKPKYYIRCKCCNLVTPAFEDPEDAKEVWEDYFIERETKLFEQVLSKTIYNINQDMAPGLFFTKGIIKWILNFSKVTKRRWKIF